MDQQDEKRLRQQAEALRKVAFTGVTVSAVASLCCIILIPGLYTYLQHVQSSVQNDAYFCRQRTEGLYRMYEQMQEQKGVKVKRQAGYGKQDPYAGMMNGFIRIRGRGHGHMRPMVANTAGGTGDYGASAGSPAQSPYGASSLGSGGPSPAVGGSDQQCCSCGIGDIGLPGAPGFDGKPGADGKPGKPGKNLDDEPQPNEPMFCFDCPEPIPGVPGDIGPKGEVGEPGDDGQPGPDGKDGKEGSEGPAGPAGDDGEAGEQGDAGSPGKVHKIPMPPGPPGPIGPEGEIGEPGLPGRDGEIGPEGQMGENGDDGKDGEDGKKGAKGEVGGQGKMGPKGGCEHCPIPRTAPGYFA